MGSCCTPDHGCSTGADGTTTTVGVPLTATTGTEPDDTAIAADDDAGHEPAGRA
ncbi:hypothetical protein [Streptomyces sp. NPDC096068]|uniref:hypothetical protein n=1 Tax=Streptomyces sp. NPDC096068 TaxID=3155424 RepID=UPI00331BCF28